MKYKRSKISRSIIRTRWGDKKIKKVLNWPISKKVKKCRSSWN